MSNKDIEYLVLTEDSDIKFINEFMKIQGLIENNSEIVSYESSTKLTSSAFSLVKYIRKNHPQVKILIHRDRDYISDDMVAKIQGQIISENCIPFITNGVDIESLFVNKQHICHLYPQISDIKVDQIIKQSIEEAREDSIARMIDSELEKYGNKKPSGKENLKILRDVENKYAISPERYFYGKKVLGLVSSKLQKEFKSNVDLVKASPFLQNAELIEFCSS